MTKREFDSELSRRLGQLEDQNLLRRLRRVDAVQGPRVELDGREFLNFSSNDYLGLASHPKLKAAASAALEKFGTGSGSSRLICGSLQCHHDLEESIASFKGTEAAILFSSGYSTALGTIPALVSKDDILVLDKLVHACIVDAARLSGAKLRIFAHNDLNDLEDILKWSDRQRAARPETRILVVVESLYSMDGDFAPLREIVALKEKYGAWLMVDEAHATGLFGNRRRGLLEQFGLTDQVEIQMGTLGKALGSSGGFIAGSRNLIEYLINRARSFIFSTAPSPSVSAAARMGIEIVQSAEGENLLNRLRENLDLVSRGLRVNLAAPDSPILPFMVGPEPAALELASKLYELGILAPAIRYPTVARNQARLRLTFSASHIEQEILTLAKTLNEMFPR